MTTTIAMLLTSALFLAPLLWSLWADARRARADVIAADVRAAISHRFRGETYLTVDVTPPSFRGSGRVTLSAPGGFEWLIEESWRDVLAQIPAGYDLLLKTGAARVAASPRAADVRSLPRAA